MVTDMSELSGTEDMLIPKEQSVVPRDTPDPYPSRQHLVASWISKVTWAKGYWESVFNRMHDDMQFVSGKQWPNQTENDDRYVANVTLRHVQQKTAALYAKNPTAVAKVRDRLDYEIWNGEMSSLQAALQAAATPDPMTGQPNPMASQVLMDFTRAQQLRERLKRIAKTLELLYGYNIDEQPIPFKAAMKQVVRRTLITGVGYVKLGFQRVLEPRPELTARIADLTEKLQTIERLAADIADGETDEQDKEAEQLRLAIQDLQAQPDQVVREGLLLDYPRSTTIIPDPECTNLRHFVGAEWVAQEYMLSPEKIQEIYGIDVRKGFRAYRPSGERGAAYPVPFQEDAGTAGVSDLGCVWEIWNKSDGLVYILCDGYPDFLREPASPDVWTERFWPFFTLIFNDTDDDEAIFPPSDVKLIRPMQQEINRCKQNLREHRIANRPKTAVAAGALDQEDIDKLRDHPANAVLELNALGPGQKVDDLLQPVKGPGIDPNLYETQTTFEDMLRVAGTQEANLGGTAGATATESSIAESSRATAVSSNMDDLDQLLSEMAHAAGQILLAETSVEVVKQVVGPGAVWPELSRAEIAKDIYLEIEAGSSGRPNQAQEISNAERLVPLLIQIPGVSPEFVARELLRRLDDRIDLGDAFAAQLPSIVAMNAMKSGPAGAPMPGPGQGPQDQAVPGQQGPAGGNNAPLPPGDQGLSPQPPIPATMLQ